MISWQQLDICGSLKKQVFHTYPTAQKTIVDGPLVLINGFWKSIESPSPFTRKGRLGGGVDAYSQMVVEFEVDRPNTFRFKIASLFLVYVGQGW